MEATRTIESMDLEEAFEDGADGYALDKIMHSGDGHAITYDDLIMLPGYIDFGVADVRLALVLVVAHYFLLPVLFLLCVFGFCVSSFFLHSCFLCVCRGALLSNQCRRMNERAGGHDELFDTQH